MFQREFAEKTKTHILCSVVFSPENLIIYWIMWESTVERNRPQMTIWRMRIACWIPKATDAHTGCVILTAFLLKQWLNEGASVLLPTLFLSRLQRNSAELCPVALLFLAIFM
jgi:hypothetical protein